MSIDKNYMLIYKKLYYSKLNELNEKDFFYELSEQENQLLIYDLENEIELLKKKHENELESLKKENRLKH